MFHVLDWAYNARWLLTAIDHLDKFTDRELDDIVWGVMLHAPHHLRAAHVIAMREDVMDVWDDAKKLRRSKRQTRARATSTGRKR
ncbi:hypothetical protein PHYC_00831 [Phycisphaerales bacterium]|nr:hypothetical protein PHYC_00831 [Phycisphaerales bacterium]